MTARAAARYPCTLCIYVSFACAGKHVILLQHCNRSILSVSACQMPQNAALQPLQWREPRLQRVILIEDGSYLLDQHTRKGHFAHGDLAAKVHAQPPERQVAALRERR